MSGLAWTVMAVICGTVWGGFLSLLIFALRREGAKRATESGTES